ncbi:MAG: hypothetical protein ABIE68_00050 [bacterium]
MSEKNYPSGFAPANFRGLGIIFAIVGLMLFLVKSVDYFSDFFVLPDALWYFAIACLLIGVYLLTFVNQSKGKFVPQSKLGKWSVGLIVVMPVLFFIAMSFTDTLYESVPAGGTIWKDIFARPALPLTMLAGMFSGILAFITGIIAVIRQRERSPLVFISTIIGALLILFLASEIISPH